MLEYFDLVDSGLYTTLSQTLSFVNALISILGLTLPDPTTLQPETSFITLTTTTHHVHLNNIKTKTLATVNMILSHIISQKRKTLAKEMKGEISCIYGMPMPQSVFTSMLETMAPTLIANIVALGQLGDFEEVRGVASVEDLYSAVISILYEMA